MEIVIRGMRNVLRNPLRLLLVVFLLGASLMLVAAMVSLNSSAQQQLANVHQEVGTAITINYATNDSQSAGQTTANAGPPGGGQQSGGGFFSRPTVTPVPNSTVAKVKNLPGVASVEESLRRTDTESTLQTSTIQTPDGRSISIPPTVNGISTGAAHFTLAGGSTPTLVSGRTFQASDATAYVAMMSQTLAQNNGLTVGSTFTLKGKTFTIIGLYTTTDRGFASNSLVIPLATMQSVFSLSGVDSITVYAQSYEQVDALAAKLRNTLGKAYDVVTEASTYANTINALNTAQNSIKLALIVAIVTATLTAQALLIIVGLGMGLAVLTSAIPAWYVARIKPAEVLRRG